MGTNVFANGNEVSGKASPNKVVASMPDVCLSPPSPPAGPIPIPYPNFAKASDTTGGSKTVKMGGEEVGLKGKSSYKQSKGDEAATRSFGGGVMSHTITGAVKHKAGSFDVKIEGSNAVRFMDITTGNHMNPGNGCVSPDAAKKAIAKIKPAECKDLREKNKEKRDELEGDDKKGTTVTHASVNGEQTWSYSRQLSAAYQNGSYSAGLDRVDTGDTTKKGAKISDVEDKRGGEGSDASNLCAAARKKFQYQTTKSTSRPHTSHTESRILESTFSGRAPPRGTVVVMAIDWNNQGKPDSNPCENCRQLICAAQECGIIIALCDKKNEAKSVEDKTGKKCE